MTKLFFIFIGIGCLGCGASDQQELSTEASRSSESTATAPLDSSSIKLKESAGLAVSADTLVAVTGPVEVFVQCNHHDTKDSMVVCEVTKSTKTKYQVRLKFTAIDIDGKTIKSSTSYNDNAAFIETNLENLDMLEAVSSNPNIVIENPFVQM